MDAQGAVDSLLGWLTTVLVSEAQLLGGVRGDVEFIKDEMESMNGLLLHLTDAQYRDHQVRAWIVGLTRDCGGITLLGGVRGDVEFIKDEMESMNGLLRHRVATRIRELKDRARDVGDRRKRYGVTVPPAPPDKHLHVSPSDDDDRPAAHPGGGLDLQEEKHLRRRELLQMPQTVEDAIKLILEWLQDEQNWWPCIPILGEGAVGIAKSVYDHPLLVSLFPHRLWINHQDIDRTSTDDDGSLYDKVKERLQTQLVTRRWLEAVIAGGLLPPKKFLLLVLHDLPFKDFYYYDLLSGLFRDLENNNSFIHATTILLASRDWDDYNSRYLDTTIFINVHRHIHCPSLFQSRALALSQSHKDPVYQIIEAIEQYCLYDAFAMQMFLHLLYINPYRSQIELKSLYDALGEHRNNTSRIMLMLCYNELPIKYKTCLQYLSIFPPGHTIRRTSLIRRWLAEGLVTDRRSTGKSADHHNKGSSRLAQLDDQAERIFDGLVARGFLRQGETSAAGKIKTCTMHHIVHDFIATDVSFMDTCLPLDLAHRFSSNSGIALQEEASPPESDHPFHGILSLLDSLPGSDQWQLLKVLDLEGCRGLTKKHLKNICKILLLKYLSLRDTDVTQLPKQINKLQCLETLDIRQTEIKAFATNFVMLPMLKHLLAGRKVVSQSSDNKNSHRFKELLATVQLPSGTRKMKKLEILSHADASNNVDDLNDIGELLQLKKLGVILDGKKTKSLDLLFKQIEKLHGCLRSLSIQINHPPASKGTVPKTEQIAALTSPPKLLQSLNISGVTSGLPDWITKLNQLTEITLSETYLGEDAIRDLGKLRILQCLRLWRKSYTGTKLTFNAEEFQHLKSLIVEGCDITNISFVNIGVAPKLQMIIWSFDSVDTVPLSGIDHLPKLKKLELNGDGDMAAVKQAMEGHPNHPVFKHNPSHQRQEDGTD
uniref:Uncharacterized protein n=1 Tax=Oryza barthii TaxID=65489 RepID=A0A0D3HPH7_9ORYZ